MKKIKAKQILFLENLMQKMHFFHETNRPKESLKVSQKLSRN